MKNERWTRWLIATLVLWGLSVAPAHALSKTEAKAEHVRLSEEMARLARRAAWRGVDRSYLAMVDLQRKDVVLTFDNHYLGAQAARELGNVTLVYRRLLEAKSADARPEATNWLGDILAQYGEVELVMPDRVKRVVELNIAVMPLQPDQRSTIGRAQARVTEGKSYDGLLPVGDYTFGEQTFQVVPGGSTIRLELDKKGDSQVSKRAAGEKEPFRLTYIGPRVDLGFAWTQAGEVSDGGAQPGDFGGAGIHGGAGVEFGVGGPWAVLIEAGYHSLGGAPKDSEGALEELDQFTVENDSMSLGYGWLAGVARLDPIWLAVGPVYAMGSGSVTGLRQDCIDKPTASECKDVTSGSERTLRYSRMEGSIKAAGAALGVSYELWSFGRFKGAATVNMGALSDASRWYPWGIVSVTIAPAGPEDNS